MRALRSLARDPGAREAAGVCVLEGPLVIAAALERGATINEVWFGHGAASAFPELTARLGAAGLVPRTLKEGVLEKIGTTRTPQPVLAVADWWAADLSGLPTDGFTLVAVDIADPGNLGTIIRSAEAAGADAVVVAGAAVDVRNPKVVRASAGAVFGIPVVEEPDAHAAVDALRARGLRTFGAVARGGAAPGTVDLAGASAVVVGNETRGLGDALLERLDATVTIPMAGAAESLNVAMAATVLCFEAARQRDARPRDEGAAS